MAVNIVIPSVGESISEGTVANWFKKDGDLVHADEPLFELETEKATTEVPAPATGVLRITVPQGQTVPIGTVIGRIEEESKAGKPPSVVKDRDGAAQPPQLGRKPVESPLEEKKEPAIQRPAQAPRQEAVLLSPAARHLVEERGLDTSQLQGSGPRGRIIKEDVLNYVKPTQEQAIKPAERVPQIQPERTESRHVAQGERDTRRRMSTIRQRIGERLVAAQHTAAMLTTFNEADLSAINDLRDRYKGAFQKKHGVKLGLMSFFVKASVHALSAYPIVNARIDGDEIVSHHYFNIGVAVNTERGLMVPVLRDVDRMSFGEIEKRLAELAEKARDGKIAVDDLQGGTFTITNGGVFGSLMSTPILNPPQSAILGMHAIQKRPVVRDDQIVIRPMMYLALSYDHRLIDGRDAVLFLVRIKECIENPERLLLEV
jgi:2-oxoglutarate dehydrogenase E2 component (dihydrolipoamide succinyltransferase)